MAACSASPQPFEYQPDNELKPGPGFFSGENGEFVIFRRPEKKDPEENAFRKLQKGDEQK
jgi:hypothetical protein